MRRAVAKVSYHGSSFDQNAISLAMGESVLLISVSADGHWASVQKDDGSSGWVSLAALHVDEADEGVGGEDGDGAAARSEGSGSLRRDSAPTIRTDSPHERQGGTGRANGEWCQGVQDRGMPSEHHAFGEGGRSGRSADLAGGNEGQWSAAFSQMRKRSSSRGPEDTLRAGVPKEATSYRSLDSSEQQSCLGGIIKYARMVGAAAAVVVGGMLILHS